MSTYDEKHIKDEHQTEKAAGAYANNPFHLKKLKKYNHEKQQNTTHKGGKEQAQDKEKLENIIPEKI